MGTNNNFSTTSRAKEITKHTDARIRQIEKDFIGVYQPNPHHLYSIFYLPSSQVSPLPSYGLAQKNTSITASA